jgi:hypothetical protein
MSSHVPDPVPLLTEATCRTRSMRQAQTVLSLTVAAVEELPTDALVQAGMGHLSYRHLPDRLTEAAALLLAGAR